MLYTLLNNRGSLTFTDVVIMLASYAALVFVMLPVHELAHAWAATLLGDNTPRWHGRLAFNPMRHIDPLGAILLVLCGFGYAKPVPVNSRNFRNPKRDMALTALAGPLSNIVMAFVSLALFRIIVELPVSFTVLRIADLVLVDTFAVINLSLAVFNLLPLPPLDGFRILSAVLPSRWVFFLEQYHVYLRWAVLLLIVTDVLDKPIFTLVNALYSLMVNILF